LQDELYEQAARYVVHTANWGEDDVQSLVASLRSALHEDTPEIREARAFVAGVLHVLKGQTT
jgi:hypothetical protein